MDMNKKVAVMQAFNAGKEVQQKAKLSGKVWMDVSSPSWNWDKNDYRIKLSKEERILEAIDGLNFVKTTIMKKVTSVGSKRISLHHKLVNKLMATLDDGDIESILIIPLSKKIDNILSFKDQGIENE
jgi:hypothetical protein